MTAIHIENLVKNYGSIRALDNLCLEVPTGSVFGFLGPNGAGKTTTMRILSGLAKPDSGTVLLEGNPIKGADGKNKQIIGYLPEEPAFYPWMTPREYLEYVGRIFGFSPVEYRKRTDELLELTGLKEVQKRHIGGFSRGMRQRLGLAQSLFNHPQILLLDEPVSALDPVGRKDVLELIEHLAHSCTVLMSTHILDDVDRICDTVGIINKGKLVTQEKRIDLLERYAIPAMEIEINNGIEEIKNAWLEMLKRIEPVKAIEDRGVVLHLTVQNVEDARREILKAVTQKELTFNRIEIVRPTLEEIFMRLVTREEKEK